MWAGVSEQQLGAAQGPAGPQVSEVSFLSLEGPWFSCLGAEGCRVSVQTSLLLKCVELVGDPSFMFHV